MILKGFSIFNLGYIIVACIFSSTIQFMPPLQAEMEFQAHFMYIFSSIAFLSP